MSNIGNTETVILQNMQKRDFLTVPTTGPIVSLTALQSHVNINTEMETKLALHLLSEASWPTMGLQPAAQSRRRQRRSTGLGVTEQQMLPEVKRMFLSFTAAPSHICLLIKTQAYPSRLLHPAAIITLQLKIFSAARKNKQTKKKISSGDAPCFGVCAEKPKV